MPREKAEHYIQDHGDAMRMPISTEDLALNGANEAQRALRRLGPLVHGLRRALLAAGVVVECDVCGGKGYPGVASLADCKDCAGSGIKPSTQTAK